jgi:hypothetical protein
MRLQFYSPVKSFLSDFRPLLETVQIPFQYSVSEVRRDFAILLSPQVRGMGLITCVHFAELPDMKVAFAWLNMTATCEALSDAGG